ncbi:phytanoyl-CoA dioxygenase family protein [uncultured Phenylobacterium sp.]|uniref:phytanoyl-CoA dioxygenase family protein n=1 Tax=uncultured Phenylobacterium sp. TaxID=349273 RepID=UPI0025DC18E8|nr:phytanoyl-CoA dioxygenase family protein [uncultured Phenylobacterium sp.]
MNPLAEAYARDGVVHIPGALDAAALAEAEAAWAWSLANPGPLAAKIPTKASDATFYQDLYNPDVLTGYRAMLQASPIPKLVADLWGGGDVWFMYEQVFLKEGGEARRTPWHQDSSYLAVAGDQLAVAWITFDAVAKSESLEFVRGSHRGRLYNGSRFDLEDDTLPTHPTSSLPRLPDIEAERDKWDIVSWAVEPGDLIVFHPAMLHGGAPTHPGQRRRTLTLRFFGDNAVYDPREGGAGPRVSGFHQRMKAGDPFRDPHFLQLAV